ncbi:hypothetical protein Ocin01_19257 [Orchesella cincta]|uniref:Uncharacterized protein n=1 Tax=Orchesella cincta TaxID=48709 RepID=A0A1D2M373_ORCCI|nr:hypothetical protein Ocin01_19257 [Orchesella cincta]
MASFPNEEPCCVILNTFSVSPQTLTECWNPKLQTLTHRTLPVYKTNRIPLLPRNKHFPAMLPAWILILLLPGELDILIANEFISESGFISPDPLRLGFDPFAPVTLGSDVPLTDPLALDPLLPDTTDATLTRPTSGGNLSNNDLDPTLEHFVLESLDTIAQAIGYRRPFVQEPMEEGANSAEHLYSRSPNIEHPPIYSPVQPEFADMEWDDNAFSDIDTSSIYSGNVDFPTWGTSSYSQDEFETDEPINLEEPIPSLTPEFCFHQDNSFNPETTDGCFQFMDDGGLCSGDAMFIWLFDAINWINCLISRNKKSQNALRTNLIALEKAYDIIFAAHHKFIKDLVSNSHQHHHYFYCDHQPAPSTDEMETTAYHNQPKDDNVEVITLD